MKGLQTAFFVGWDVGGWHCDKNTSSRDALVILDADLKPQGQPWRGNLRRCIDDATTTTDWLRVMFRLCAAEFPAPAQVTLAIDTPLGFSAEFVRLLTGGGPVARVGDDSGLNPYLFRTTERYLYERGVKPLSPVKDMIGSQATKGLHALAKFAPRVLSCGVWGDGEGLQVIEAYPSPCRHSNRIHALAEPYSNHATLNHSDKQDALTCALVANLFATDRTSLIPPEPTTPVGEGWIWIPRDALAADMV